MLKSSICLFCLATLLASCSSHMAVLQQDRHQSSLALSEIREQIADLKHELNSTQVELQILDEQIKKPGPSHPSSKMADTKTANWEKKLEKSSSQMHQMSQELIECRTKIGELEAALEKQALIITEIVQLKSILSHLKSSLDPGVHTVTHKVKSGDSLEKIARFYKVTIQAIKEENKLSHDTIIIGQELKIPQSP
jgi:LysM repeat protein